MDFNLTESHRLIQEMTRKFCANEIDPIAAGLEKDGMIPDHLLKKYADLGLFGMMTPKEYDGSGTDHFAHLLAIEQLAYAGTTAWWPVAFNNSIPETICRFGTTHQKEAFVKGNLDGTKLFSVQFTEPDTGSDPGAFLTRSTPDDDYYIINGQKRFSTFGARPGPAIVWTKDEKNGCTCFLVEKLAPGYAAPKTWELMGSGGAETIDVFYDDYRVKKDQILGEKGKGMDILLHWISIEKLEGCIAAIGLAQAALDETIDYTKSRIVKGSPMSDMQGVRFELADMYAKIQACRWMVYRTAHLLEDSAKRFQIEASACKITVQPQMSDVIATAFRLHGGYGYTKDYKIERLYRAQAGNMVISVSLEINKSIVGDSLLKHKIC